MSTEVLVRVQSKHFIAGFTLLDDVCITTSPILYWAKGKQGAELRQIFKDVGWKATIVKSPVDTRVVLSRDGLLSASAEERRQLEEIFGRPMINSIVGGNAKEFEGEWEIK